MMNRSLRICYFICIVLLLVSCSTTKFVPDGEYLLDKVEIETTPKEYELLSYLIKNKNVVMTRDSILESVWGYDYSGSGKKCERDERIGGDSKNFPIIKVELSHTRKGYLRD